MSDGLEPSLPSRYILTGPDESLSYIGKLIVLTAYPSILSLSTSKLVCVLLPDPSSPSSAISVPSYISFLFEVLSGGVGEVSSR